MPKYFVQDAKLIVNTYEIEAVDEADMRKRYDLCPNRECNTSDATEEYNLGIFHFVKLKEEPPND